MCVVRCVVYLLSFFQPLSMVVDRLLVSTTATSINSIFNEACTVLLSSTYQDNNNATQRSSTAENGRCLHAATTHKAAAERRS